MPSHGTSRPSGRSSSRESSRSSVSGADDGLADTAPSFVPPRSAGARKGAPSWTRCRTCRRAFVAASLVAGECAGCAGLVPLDLRGDGGKFLPGLTHGPTPNRSRPIAPARTRRDDDL